MVLNFGLERMKGGSTRNVKGLPAEPDTPGQGT